MTLNKAFLELEQQALREMEEHDKRVTEQATHIVNSVATANMARGMAEKMAELLAEMGRASQKVTGDNPHFAVTRWASIILRRAHELLGAGVGTPLKPPFKCDCGREYRTYGGLEECRESEHFPNFPREVERRPPTIDA